MAVWSCDLAAMSSSSLTAGGGRRRRDSERPSDAHIIFFYEDDHFFVDVVVEFLVGGQKSSDRLLVIATQAHRELLLAALGRRGLDVSEALAGGTLAMIDAQTILERASSGGELDVEQLLATLDAIMQRAVRNEGRLRAYGELAGMLCERGLLSACRRVEEYWRDFVKQHSLAVLCGYRGGQTGCTHGSELAQLREVHTVTLPSEHTSSLGRLETRLQSLFLLENRVQVLEADLVQAQRVEDKLRRESDSLRLRLAAAREILRNLVASSQRELAELGLDGPAKPEAAGQLLLHVTHYGQAIAEVLRVLEETRSP
jgi:hypothetical protein